MQAYHQVTKGAGQIDTAPGAQMFQQIVTWCDTNGNIQPFQEHDTLVPNVKSMTAHWNACDSKIRTALCSLGVLS